METLRLPKAPCKTGYVVQVIVEGVFKGPETIAMLSCRRIAWVWKYMAAMQRMYDHHAFSLRVWQYVDGVPIKQYDNVKLTNFIFNNRKAA